MQCAANLDSLLALSPVAPTRTRTRHITNGASAAVPVATSNNGKSNSNSNSVSSANDEGNGNPNTSSPTLSALERRASSSSTLESLDLAPDTRAAFSSTESANDDNSSKMTTTAETETSDNFGAAAPDKENTISDGTAGSKTKANNNNTTTTMKECTSCHLPKSRAEYSASQWKKKKSANTTSKSTASSGRRCIECIASSSSSSSSSSSGSGNANAQAEMQTKAVMAAAVAIGTVGAVCAASSTTAAASNGGNALKAKKNKKKKGLADRTNSASNNTNEALEEKDDMDMDMDMDIADVELEPNVEEDEDVEEEDEDEDVEDEEEDDALTLTNFDQQTNASLLTVEQSPAKPNNNNAATGTGTATGTLLEPIIGVIHEEEDGPTPTPRAADGQVFAGFSPVACATSSTTTGNVANGSIPADDKEVEGITEDEALMSTYSFSLYEAEVSLEHIRSLQSTSSADPANVLTVATDALALPCFKENVLRELTASSRAMASPSPQPHGGVCSPTVNSMASMFATHAAMAMASPFAGTGNEFASPSPSAAAATPGSGAGSPLRLTGIDTRHLSDVYSQLQMMAAQSELALEDADSALARIESILRNVVVESDEGDAVIEMSTSSILELGMVLSDAFWVVGDASKADAVRQILTDRVKQPTSDGTSDEADMAASGNVTGTATSSAQDLAGSLLKVMDTDENEELEPIAEDEEDEANDEDSEITIPTASITTAKHVHFDTSSLENSSPRSPVAEELNDINERKIASSILKGGGYPSNTIDEVDDALPHDPGSETADGKSSRPDVIQHLYHNYRSSFEFGKEHIPVGGLLLGLAESTASTSIKIASLGHLDLQTMDEGFIGPHIIKGLDDILVNPVIESVGGVVDGIGGAVGAVVSVLPFIGGGKDEEEKEE